MKMTPDFALTETSGKCVTGGHFCPGLLYDRDWKNYLRNISTKSKTNFRPLANNEMAVIGTNEEEKRK